MELYRALIALALRRPALVPALLGLAWAARRRGWWRRFPFLPLPPASYLRWRLDTAYGDPTFQAPAEETARYLLWAARMRGGR
jgi:hypothetical protein